MKDTCYLVINESGIDRMTKNPPRKASRYVVVHVEVPDPPQVTLTLPAASPVVTGALHEQPVPVDGQVWCDVHEFVHDELPVYAVHREPTHG